MAKQGFGAVLGVLLLAAGLLGCSPNTEQSVATMTRHVLEHDGLEREYFVYLPSKYDSEAKLPVAIFMHGYGGTATGAEVRVAQGLNYYAEKFGYVMVYPQGTWFMTGDSAETQRQVTSWNHISDGFDAGPDGPICAAGTPPAACPPECGTCGQCGWTSCHDDVGFLKSLVATVSADYAIDSESVFVSGFSNGAMMANRIACEASELFAGVALVGGRLERGFECTPTKKLPLLQINGGKDITVPADGSKSSYGYFFSSSSATAEHWNDGQACAADRKEWLPPATAETDVQCTIACGDSDSASIDCIWPDGNHRWPGTPGSSGSNGYCVSELQSASMPDQSICVDADYSVDIWGSRLLFSFFDEQRAQ